MQKTPDASKEFIIWLFSGRCIVCHRKATEINEIIPRSRSRKSIINWKNRVTLCQSCHAKYHNSGVSSKSIKKMQNKRDAFLLSVGRKEYI